MIAVTINGKKHTLDVEGEMPLLWALRDELGLTGTKFGCGAGLCGACSIMLNGEVVRSCVTPVESVDGAEIVTIEGLETGEKLSAVQQAWIEEQVPQCGYCQPGFLMAVSGLLAQTPHPSDEQIAETITNICRCGTYDRIRRAIRRAIELKADGGAA